MGGSSFDLIMREVLNQKQQLNELVEENQNLKRQLADLRTGRGILLEIGGQQFVLNEGAAAATPGGVVAPAQELSSYETTMSAPINEVVGDAIPQNAQPVDGEISSMSGDPRQASKGEAVAHTSFLEDLLVDEFASAATSPMMAWKGSAGAEGNTAIDEEAKAALRRELSGSFLLE